MLEREQSLLLGLDDDGHAHAGILLFQDNDVLVQQADAALAGAARHGALVVGAAVDADAAMTGGLQAQEPVPVGQDAASPVAEVVFPSRGILNHGNGERLAVGRFGRAHVALALLVPLVLPHAHGKGLQGYSVAPVAGIHGERQVLLGNDDKCRVLVGGNLGMGNELPRCSVLGSDGIGCGGLLLPVLVPGAREQGQSGQQDV